MDSNSNNDQAFANFSYPTVGATPGSVSQPSHISSTQVDPKIDEQLAAQLPPVIPVTVSKPADLDSQITQLSNASANTPMSTMNSSSKPSDPSPIDPPPSDPLSPTVQLSDDRALNDISTDQIQSSTIAPPTFGSPQIRSEENSKGKNPLRSLAKKLSSLGGGLIESEDSRSDTEDKGVEKTVNAKTSNLTQIKEDNADSDKTPDIASDVSSTQISTDSSEQPLGSGLGSSNNTSMEDKLGVPDIDTTTDEKFKGSSDSMNTSDITPQELDGAKKEDKVEEIASMTISDSGMQSELDGSTNSTTTLQNEAAISVDNPDLKSSTITNISGTDQDLITATKQSSVQTPSPSDSSTMENTIQDSAIVDPVDTVISDTVDSSKQSEGDPLSEGSDVVADDVRTQVVLPEMNFVQLDPNMSGGLEHTEAPLTQDPLNIVESSGFVMQGDLMPEETLQVGVSPVLSEPISKIPQIDPVESVSPETVKTVEQLTKPTPTTDMTNQDVVHGPTVAELTAKDNSPTPMITSKGRYPYTIEQLLDIVMERDASDLHLSVGYPAMIRVDGQLINVIEEIVSPEQIQDLVLPVLPEQKKELLEVNREVDLAYSHRGSARFRINAYYQQQTLAGAFRLIPNKIRSIDELKLPQVFHQITKLRQGLVLVTGPTGSGKSTTLAAILQEINESRPDHIITIEDPVEYVFPKGRSMVDQRELHEDTHSWEIALKSALRQDPDVMLVGEMRDFDTISSAITLAETGHLVFATLHTNSASQTIDRIIDVFPEHQQAQVRSQLSNTIEAVIAQRLIPVSAGGRRAVSEIMLATPAIRNLIRESKNHQIDNVIRTSADMGMISLEHSLVKLVRDNVITMERAQEYAVHPEEVVRLLKS